MIHMSPAMDDDEKTMRRLWRWVYAVGIHFIAFFAFLQTFSYAFGFYDELYLILKSNRMLVVGGVVVYAVFHYLMYGGREVAYYSRYRKKVANLPPPDDAELEYRRTYDERA
jgi:hypothetical protein